MERLQGAEIMATNKPTIAAWAPSTALAKLESRHNNAPCVLTDGPAEFNDVALVRLSDYEALKAECEKLRKDAERYQWLADACVSDWLGEEGPVLVHAKPWNTNWRAELDAAIDAAMEGDKP